MLMICWFYCIPFAKALFFAFSPLLVVFSLFVLKRGIRQSRPALRQMAFLLMFLAVLKEFTVDIYLLRSVFLCGDGFLQSFCNASGFRGLRILGLMALVASSVAIFNGYRIFLSDRRQKDKTPEQVRLPFWANFSISLVALLVAWLCAPWVGYLTVGHVPQLFMAVSWQYLAVLNIVVLLIGFWKLEDCNWIYNPSDKGRKKYLTRVWTPRDTLWLAVTLFLIALAFSYISNDVLSTSPLAHRSEHVPLESIDLSDWDSYLHLPQF